MSSLNRAISGNVLYHRLKRDELTLDTILLAEHGRTARTLVKEGPLRLTLMAIAANGDLPEHRTDGPITIHVLQGEIVFHAEGERYELRTGDVLVFAAGVPHSAQTTTGCLFLLTVVHTEDSALKAS
jgi:quercetin dioxygenase-like cupin family protein